MGLYYSIGSLLVFYLLLIGEFFVPSGGMIGIAAIVSGITAILLAFAHSTSTGITFLVLIGISTPAILVFMIQLWPHTPIGRKILNRKPGQLHPKKEHKMRDGTPVSELIGQVGTAQTDLLPGGRVLINGRKLDAVSTGMPIDSGTEVVVVKTQAGKIQVRKALESDKTNSPSSDTNDTVQQTETPSVESSLESLDLDSLE